MGILSKSLLGFGPQMLHLRHSKKRMAGLDYIRQLRGTPAFSG